MRIRISARKSDLARLQAIQVGQALQKKNPKIEIIYNFRESLGDKNLTDPLWKIPQKGVFTEDFLQDLIDDKTDLVVHSWKDLPTEKKDKTHIACTLPRADQRDLLLMKKSSAQKSRIQIFSSSPRREYNLGTLLPELIPWSVSELKFTSVRGNIQTRVRKLLEDPATDGLILAKAALDRLLTVEGEEFIPTKSFLRESLDQLRWMVLPLSANPCAAAQGALAVEIKNNREDLKQILSEINCEKTFFEAQAERDLLQSFGGGCHLALGMSLIKTNDYVLTYVRGKTPQGVSLEKKELLQKNVLLRPQFLQEELWSLGSEEIIRSEKKLFTKLDANQAYIVSRFEAWPQNQAGLDLKVWTSGLKTWKKLAAQGVWVLGTFDGLGDHQPPNTESLMGQITWKTLTHAGHPFFDSNKHIATYETDLPELKIKNQKYFFWRSSSQFLKALEKYPDIVNQTHATGPGSTLRTLREYLPEDKIFIFLNEEDWRRSC